MKVEITRELLRDIKAGKNALDIADTKTVGFGVRVMPSGAIHYAIRYTDANGKRARFALKRSFPTTNISEARALAVVELGRIANGSNPAEEKRAKQASKLTFDAFIDGEYGDFLRHRPKTAPEVIKRLKKRFSTFKDLALSEIDAQTVERWRVARTRAGIAPATINRDIGALKPMFTKAVEWGLLPVHPLSGLKALKSVANPIDRYLSEAEEIRLREALDARELRDRTGRESGNLWRSTRKYELLPAISGAHFVDYLTPAILLSLNTGIRQGELTSLLWSNVNLGDNPSIFISGDLAKSGKARHVALNSEALEVLVRWKKQLGNTLLVFPGKNGRQKVEVKTAWRSLLINAAIENFRWHDMRHTFASNLVMAGEDLNTVRELLGHSDLKMTLRYAHLAPEHKAAAVQKLVRKPSHDAQKKLLEPVHSCV